MTQLAAIDGNGNTARDSGPNGATKIDGENMTEKARESFEKSFGRVVGGTLEACRATRTPIILWGPPGIGKTAGIEAAAEACGAQLEVLIGSTMDPTDISYLLPDPSNNRVNFAPSELFARLKRALDEGREAWLLLDEITSAPVEIHAVFLRLINEQRIPGLDLRGIWVLAAANPTDHAVGGFDLGAPLANRLHHQPVEFDVSVWAKLASEGFNGKASGKYLAALQLIAQFAVSTHGKDHRVIMHLPKDHEKQGSAWPSPRAWDNVAKMLGHVAEGNRATDIIRAARSDVGSNIIAGLVGPHAAQAFLQWCRTLDVPDPMDLLRDHSKLPKRPDAMFVAVDSALRLATERSKGGDHGLLKNALTLLSYTHNHAGRIDLTFTSIKWFVDYLRNDNHKQALVYVSSSAHKEFMEVVDIIKRALRGEV